MCDNPFVVLTFEYGHIYWNYFANGHGKGEVDGANTHLK